MVAMTRGALQGLIWRSCQPPLHTNMQLEKPFVQISDILCQLNYNKWFPFFFNSNLKDRHKHVFAILLQFFIDTSHVCCAKCKKKLVFFFIYFEYPPTYFFRVTILNFSCLQTRLLLHNH